MINVNNMRFIVCVIVLITLSVTRAGAELVALPKMDDALRDVDVICVVESLGGQQAKSQDGRKHKLLVVRPIIGTVNAGDTITADLCNSSLSLSKHNLVFLKNTDEQYTYWNRYFSALPVSTQRNISPETSADARKLLQWEFCNTLAGDDKQIIDYTFSIVLLAQRTGFLSDDQVVDYVLPLAKTESDRIQPKAMAYCIQYADMQEIIPDALEWIKNHNDCSVLCSAIREVKVKDEYLNMVGDFVDSEVEWARNMATYVLRESKNEIAIPYLVRSIDDPSRQVRLNAAIGLSNIHDDQEAMRLFNEDEQAVAKYWQEKYPEYK